MITRRWVLIGKEQIRECSTSKRPPGLGALIATFRPGSEADDKTFAEFCIAEASKPEVLTWLNFAPETKENSKKP